MAFPYRTTGSLRPAFAPARRVCLAVKHPYAFTLSVRFPTVLRIPLRSSVTLWEETAPVKLPTTHCSGSGLRTSVRTPNISGWYSSFWLHQNWRSGFVASHLFSTGMFKIQYEAVVKVHGVFPSSCGYAASSQRVQFR